MAFEVLTGTTPFRGDSALAVAQQRLDHDVPRPSSVIDGVPPQLDAFIVCATARNPDERFPDASAMAEELEFIADELDLPQFRVPAPRNSAQHAAATVAHRRPTDRAMPPSPQARPAGAPPVRQHTRQFTPAPLHRGPGPRGHGDAAEFAPDFDDYDRGARQFAGIDIEDFAWARQRARRAQVFWVVAVLVLTCLVATAAWAVGTNLDGLIGR
jgi:serine/threonine-protein kinase